MRLEGKIALITGGTSGIGRATARLFCKEGARVVIVGRTESKGNESAKLIVSEGGEATYIRADVSKAVDVENAVRKTVDKYGRIDIVFNNAGIPPMGFKMEEISEEDWERMIAVNLKSIFLVSKYVVPLMKAQGGGVIINTASTYGFVGRALGTAYCAAKGGVVQFTKATALELAPHNIRVNCVCPGTTVSEAQDGFILYGRAIDSDWVEDRMKNFPIGRLGRPEDIASAALFLASDDSSFVTGSALLVDGGYTIR